MKNVNSRENLRNGLSGIIRAKNESRFLEACIDSCVNVLDELVIVYNDCTDSTPEIIERKVKQYPGKIKAYPYNYNVVSHNLTREEFEYAKALPEDSLQLHSNQCNYALSKVTCKYAVKIDADQIYIESEVLKWRNICYSSNLTFKLRTLFGFMFSLWLSLYRRISAKCGFPCLVLLPRWLCKLFNKSYHDYARWMLVNDRACVAWSGLNLFYDNGWFVPFDGINIHPPYNGEGDTLIFKVSDKTFYTRFCKEGPPFSVIEVFNHPYKKMTFGPPVWFHLHANRTYCVEKVRNVKMIHPEWFLTIDEFLTQNYKQVHARMNHKSHTLYQRILFAYVHNIGRNVIKANALKLNDLILKDVLS